MKIFFHCKQCGDENQAEFSQAGRRVACSKCGAANTVPAPLETAGPAPSPPAAAPVPPETRRRKVACGRCGWREIVAVDVTASSIQCGGCGAKLLLPSDRPAGTASPAVAPPAPRAPREPPPVAPPRAPRESPSATAPRAPAAALPPAVASLEALVSKRPEPEPALPSRSAMLEARARTEAEAAEQERARAEETPQPKPKRKRRKKKRTGVGLEENDVFVMVMAALAVDAVLGLIAILYPGLRTILGGLCVAVGGLLTFVGTVGFSRVARDEGTMYGFLCKVVPLYKMYYLITRWDVMRDHFIFYAVGCLLLYPGLLLWKVVPHPRADSHPASARAGLNPQAKSPVLVDKPQADQREEDDEP